MSDMMQVKMEKKGQKWPTVKLGSLVEVMHQGINTAADKVVYAENGFPIIQSKHLKDDLIDLTGVKYLNESDVQKYSLKYTPKQDDILFANIGSIGKSLIVRKPVSFMFAWNVFLIRPKHELVNVSYLKYFFDRLLNINYYDRFLTGGTVKFVNKTVMSQIEIPLPPLNEQKRIAAILDKADGIRRKRQQAIELADEFLRSVFLDMFGDPVANPKGWDVKPLKDIAIVTTGNTPSRKKPEYYGNHIEWIKSDNINTPSHYLTKAAEYLSEDGYQVGRSVNSGSVLVTCIAGSFDCIGNVAYKDREVCFNQQINALTPKDGVNGWFLYALILFSKKQIQSASTNSMKGMVSKGKMENIQVISPPEIQQKEFEKIFFAYLQKMRKAQTSLGLCNESFSAISQKAFSGEL